MLAGAVIALVAIVVAAAALLAPGAEQRLGSRPRPPATSNPRWSRSPIPRVPTNAGMTARWPPSQPTRTWASSAAGSPTPDRRPDLTERADGPVDKPASVSKGADDGCRSADPGPQRWRVSTEDEMRGRYRRRLPASLPARRPGIPGAAWISDHGPIGCARVVSSRRRGRRLALFSGPTWPRAGTPTTSPAATSP